jgi:hypothetical protein
LDDNSSSNFFLAKSSFFLWIATLALRLASSSSAIFWRASSLVNLTEVPVLVSFTETVEPETVVAIVEDILFVAYVTGWRCFMFVRWKIELKPKSLSVEVLDECI